MNFFLIPFLSAILLLLQIPVTPPSQDPWSGESEETPEEAPQAVVYSFLQAFPEAQAARSRGVRKAKGQWTGDRFTFQNAAGLGDISVTMNTPVAGRSGESILFQLEPGVESQLIFSRVPPARNLKVFLAMPDSDFQKEKPSPIGFEVWVGGKKVFETEVTRKGWKEEDLDLTLPFLLQRNLVVTFKVRTVDSHQRSILFRGYLE